MCGMEQNEPVKLDGERERVQRETDGMEAQCGNLVPLKHPGIYVGDSESS